MNGYAELVNAKQFPLKPPVDCNIIYGFPSYARKNYYFFIFII